MNRFVHLPRWRSSGPSSVALARQLGVAVGLVDVLTYRAAMDCPRHAGQLFDMAVRNAPWHLTDGERLAVARQVGRAMARGARPEWVTTVRRWVRGEELRYRAKRGAR